MGISPLMTVALAMNNAEGEPSWAVVAVTGIVLVFCVLILLYLLITFEGVIFTSIDKKKGSKKPAAKAPAPAPVPQAAKQAPAPVVEAGIPGEVVAAIAAALACMEGGSRYAVRSISRAKTGRSAWSQAGVVSYTEPF